MKKAKIQFTLATLCLLAAAGIVYYYFKHGIEGTKLSLAFCLALAVCIVLYLIFYYFSAGNARDARCVTNKEKADSLLIRFLHLVFILLFVVAVLILCFTVVGLFYPVFLPGALRTVFDPVNSFRNLKLLAYGLAAVTAIQVPACLYLLVSSLFTRKGA